MFVSKANRIDPRALLAKVSSETASCRTSSSTNRTMRLLAFSSAAIVVASAFGAIVVQANDENSAMMFMRQNARPVTRSAPVYRPAPPTQYYYAPQAFYPRSQPRVTRPAVASSYAPFVGFFPSENSKAKAPRRKVAEAKSVPRSSSVTLTLPSKSTDYSIGGKQTYCVRTCDGFYFPLSTSTGSEKGDEIACNNLCPTSETKLYIGTRGADIDNARGRESGRIYASMSNAFGYRKAIDKSCSCSVNGYGLSTITNVSRDGTLRIGDIVMTKTGMKVFSGGTFPYRDGNFASLGRSNLIDNSTRENLRKVEQASLPGRSGLANVPLASAKKNNEAQELKAATALSERADRGNASTAMRYIGPDRTIIAR